MFTVGLSDKASIKTSLLLNGFWLLLYVVIYAVEAGPLAIVALYFAGIIYTYALVWRWNHRVLEISCINPNSHALYRPCSFSQIDVMAKIYIIPMMILFWLPVFAGMVFIPNLLSEMNIVLLGFSLIFSQLVLFDCVNIIVRFRMLKARGEHK